MLQHGFQQRYGQAALLVRAPGRINLIGEHTDYNQGHVMPAAIDLSMELCFGHRHNSPQIRAFSCQYQQEITLNDTSTPNGWARYLQASYQVLLDAGIPVGGTDIMIDSRIPEGAGLSSSAALCCGLIAGMSRLHGVCIPEREIALLAQEAEHRCGVNCGIMDQYAVLFGRKDQWLALNCGTMAMAYVPISLKEGRLMLVDSGVRHALAAGQAYNERRASCERVVHLVQQGGMKTIRSLSELRPEMLDAMQGMLPETDFRRARYVLQENERVISAGQALREGRLDILGPLLSASHEGLRRQYEVTVPETDWLVDYLVQLPGVWGARQLGAGFGGCVLVLSAAPLTPKLLKDYRAATGKEAKFIPLRPADGLSVRIL